MCGTCGTAVATSKVVPQGSPQGMGWHVPTCTITHSDKNCACSAAWAHWSSGVTKHTCVGAWGCGNRVSGQHVRIGRLVFIVRQHVAEDVQGGRRRMEHRPLPGGGQAALTAVAPDMEVEAVRGHPRASVGVLFSFLGVDEPQAGVPRAGGVEKVDQGVAPSWVVGGPLFATAVVEVLIGALVEALPHHCWQ